MVEIKAGKREIILMSFIWCQIDVSYVCKVPRHEPTWGHQKTTKFLDSFLVFVFNLNSILAKGHPTITKIKQHYILSRMSAQHYRFGLVYGLNWRLRNDNFYQLYRQSNIVTSNVFYMTRSALNETTYRLNVINAAQCHQKNDNVVLDHLYLISDLVAACDLVRDRVPQDCSKN